MTTARNTIIAGIQSELWNVEWDDEPVSLVERNLRRMVSADEKTVSEQLTTFPSLWIMNEVDEVIKVGRKTNTTVEYTRRWELAITTFFQGSSEDAAPVELEEFQELVKQAMYRAGNALKCGITEVASSEVIYPEFGNNVVAQTIQFEIVYVEQINF